MATKLLMSFLGTLPMKKFFLVIQSGGLGCAEEGAGGGKASGGAQGSAFAKESAPLLEHCWSTYTHSFSLVSVDVYSLMASVLLLLPMDASASSTVRMASLDQWQLGMSSFAS